MWRRATRSCGLVLGLTVYPLVAMAQGNGEPTGSSGPTGTSGQAGTSPSDAAGTGVVCEAAKVVEFKGTSAVLSSDAKMTLDQIAMTAKDPGSSVRLLGSSGQKKRATKAKIAERRTDAVKGYLAEAGINPALITASPPDPAAPKPDVAESVEIVTCAQPVAQAPLPPSPPVAAVPETPPPPPVEPLPSEVSQAPMGPLPTEPAPAPSYLHPVKTNVGVEAMVGGSVMGFADEQARSVADTGGGWEARLSVGTRLPLAVEAAYVGSAQNIEALGLDDSAVLVGSAAEAVARVNFTRNLRFQPYVFGGVGWQHYDLTNEETNNSAIREDDDLFTIPAGAGISFRLVKGLVLDVRGTFRTAFDEDLMNAAYSATGQDANLHTWDAGARLGWEF